MSDYNGKKILITGGTGSLGYALTKRLLNLEVDTIRIFSRNENKQIEMENCFQNDKIRFLIGDVRDSPRLEKALEGIDIVFHAAALKHVPVIEYNPFEAIKTNVLGAQNLIDTCLKQNVDTVVGVGTDKAVSPLNTYGATKLLMEKLLTTAQNYLDKEKYKTKFLAVRYGNVLGSSGSVLPKFVNQIRNKQKITITDPNMTRFSLTMDEAIDHILSSTLLSKISEVFIPKARSYTITDLKEALFELLEDTGEDIISSRPGEKKHEILINSDEAKFAWEFDNKYVIFNPFRNEDEIKSAHPGIKKANFLIDYTSEMVEKIPKNELKQIITDCGFLK